MELAQVPLRKFYGSFGLSETFPANFHPWSEAGCRLGPTPGRCGTRGPGSVSARGSSSGAGAALGRGNASGDRAALGRGNASGDGAALGRGNASGDRAAPDPRTALGSRAAGRSPAAARHLLVPLTHDHHPSPREVAALDPW